MFSCMKNNDKTQNLEISRFSFGFVDFSTAIDFEQQISANQSSENLDKSIAIGLNSETVSYRVVKFSE